MSARSQSKQLKEVVAFQKGKPPAKHPYEGSDAELYLTPEYLRGRGVAELIKPAANSVRVDGGETIVLWDGSNAGEVFRARHGNLSSTMSLVSHGDGYLPDYFYYSLKAWESYLKGQTSGSGIPHVDKEVLGGLTLFHCTKPEQAKIAEVLSTVDRGIAQTEALIAKQQRIKTGLMADLLTRGIDADGHLRTEATHAFKDSPLGRIPVEWEVKTLSSIVDENITYGIVQAGPHIDGGVPYIRTGDMSGDHIMLDGLLRTSKSIAKSYARSTVYLGDIVFALRATVGKVLPVTPEINGANLTQGTAKISPSKSTDSDFLLWALRSEAVQEAISLEMKGTTFMEITLTNLREVKIAVPTSTEEQQRIAEIIDIQHASECKFVDQKKKLRYLKTALMQDLLAGKKRVTDLLDTEVAG